MDTIIEQEKCTGCGACNSSCPKEAIRMHTDKEGFDFPFIDSSKCIDCGICRQVCPPLHYGSRENKRQDENSVQRGYAARNKNIEERQVSSSGSIFVVLAHCILLDGGVVVGVAYDTEFNAVYRMITDERDIYQLQGSKYLQCKADKSCFCQIRNVLKAGRKVLFSGLACQVEGLRAFLRKDYENLFCVDLICMGIPSPVVWQEYLHSYFPNERILEVNFKEKSVGWDHFNLSIKTDKRQFKQWGMENPYFKSMFNTYNMRRSCFCCPFKNINRAADITLADCWGASRLVPSINDNKGLSSVVVHSKKGLSLWQQAASYMDSIELALDDIVRGNTNMIENRSCDWNKRKIFYRLLHSSHPQKAFRFAEKQGIERTGILMPYVRKIIKKFLKLLKDEFKKMVESA